MNYVCLYVYFMHTLMYAFLRVMYTLDTLRIYSYLLFKNIYIYTSTKACTSMCPYVLKVSIVYINRVKACIKACIKVCILEVEK